jgi:hypothetical protein
MIGSINEFVDPCRYKIIFRMLSEDSYFSLEAVRMVDVVGVGSGDNVVLTVFHTLIKRYSQAPVLLKSDHVKRWITAFIIADHSLQVFRQPSVFDKYDIIRLYSLCEDAV